MMERLKDLANTKRALPLDGEDFDDSLSDIEFLNRQLQLDSLFGQVSDTGMQAVESTLSPRSPFSQIENPTQEKFYPVHSCCPIL